MVVRVQNYEAMVDAISDAIARTVATACIEDIGPRPMGITDTLNLKPCPEEKPPEKPPEKPSPLVFPAVDDLPTTKPPPADIQRELLRLSSV